MLNWLTHLISVEHYIAEVIFVVVEGTEFEVKNKDVYLALRKIFASNLKSPSILSSLFLLLIYPGLINRCPMSSSPLLIKPMVWGILSFQLADSAGNA